jgi:hypothetical protein
MTGIKALLNALDAISCIKKEIMHKTNTIRNQIIHSLLSIRAARQNKTIGLSQMMFRFLFI